MHQLTGLNSRLGEGPADVFGFLADVGNATQSIICIV